MFTDIDETFDETRKGWDAISYVVDANLMSGYPDGSFRPDETVTLGEICCLISKMLPPENENIDFPPGHWARGYAEYCKKNGYIPQDMKIKTKWLNKALTYEQLHEIISCILVEKPISFDLDQFGFLREDIVHREITRVALAKLLYKLLPRLGADVVSKIKTLVYKKSYDAAFETITPNIVYKNLLPLDISYAYDLSSKKDQIKTLLFAYMMRVMQCKRCVFRKVSGCTRVFHYTSLKALECLTQTDARLHLSPVAYLNDPTEGDLGLKLAKKEFSKYGVPFQDWHFGDITDVYIASFSLHERESIPMWVHYGDSGKGAMAGINVSDLGEDVYEVTYQTEKQFSKYLEKVQFIMDEFLALPEAEDEETKKRLFHFVKASVEQVCYLCKDEYYSYEKEARIVLIRDLEKIKTEDKPRENEVFPRIYVPMEGEMKISSVTLGPLVSSRAAITLALAKRGIPPEVIHESKVPYHPM